MRLRPLALLLVLAAVPAFAARQRAVRHPAGPAPASGAPTFSGEVVRIFQQHCQSCHRPGDIAPFSLMTYAEAKPHANLIKLMTHLREMPPWKPVDGCGEFRDERRLTAAEIATIGKWVEAGAPEGDVAQLPAQKQFPGVWTLGEPDLILASAEPYTPPPHQDTYRCFTIPTNQIGNKFVGAVDTRPGDRATVHHVISFVDTQGVSVKLDEAEPGPGYTCFGDPGFPAVGTIGAWAPGSPPLELPDGVAFPLPANARVVLQVHYHPHSTNPVADQTQFGIYFTNHPSPKEMRMIPLINDSFTIPPNDANYRVDATFPFAMPVPLKLWLIAPHMHLLGRRMQVQMQPRTGPAECLIEIDDWDFNWQGAYRYVTPVSVPAGARISLSAYYDNSSNNPRNPNSPPRAVSWGEATTDEMCIAFLGVTLD